MHIVTSISEENSVQLYTTIVVRLQHGLGNIMKKLGSVAINATSPSGTNTQNSLELFRNFGLLGANPFPLLAAKGFSQDRVHLACCLTIYADVDGKVIHVFRSLRIFSARIMETKRRSLVMIGTMKNQGVTEGRAPF